jgi:hypothetical protein
MQPRDRGPMTARYGAVVEGKPGAYGVVVPDLPRCTARKTIDAAIVNAERGKRSCMKVMDVPAHSAPDSRLCRYGPTKWARGSTHLRLLRLGGQHRCRHRIPWFSHASRALLFLALR